MKIQLLSDLHLETEVFEATAAPGAELLILAGDIDSHWTGLQQFRGWPQPVVFIAGNHEFDGREIGTARAALRDRCTSLGIRLLECESLVLPDSTGRRVRIVGTTRWSDFDLFGPARRDRAMRAGGYFARHMKATRQGRPFDAAEVRAEALQSRAWLAQELQTRRHNDWDATVVVTHFAPSLRSADPRYGPQPGTASFCNADDDLLPYADVWLHGHLHCAHDYRAPHPGGSTRVVCNPRGHERKGEAASHRPHLLIDV